MVAATFEYSTSRRALLWLASLNVAALIVAFDPVGDSAFDLPKSLASRSIEWATAAALIVALLSHGRGILPRTRLHAAVVGLVVTVGLAAVFATEPYVAIFGEQDRYLGLTWLGNMLVLYAALAVAIRGTRDVFLILGAIAASAVVALGYAVLQLIDVDPFVWATDARIRPFSTFGNPDQFGHFISVLFGLALGAVLAPSGAARRTIAAIAAIAALAVAAFVATRGTLVGIAGALAGTVGVRPSRRVILATAALAVAIGAGLLATPLGQRAVGTFAGGVLPDRITLYGIAARATLARPLLGYGPDNFRAAFVGNRTPESLASLTAGPETSAHDWLLDASATTGLVGLAALLALLTLGTLELLGLARGRPAVGTPLLLGWAAYWTNGLVDVGSVTTAWFPWLALGIAAGLRGTQAETVARRVPRWAIAAIGIATVIGIVGETRPFIANREAWAAAQAAHFGDKDAAVALADHAAARDGGRADHWNRLGLALEAQRRWADAAAAYREAASRERYEPVYWANLANALVRTGARDDALAAAREAAAVDRNAPIGHVAVAETALAFRQCDVARVEAARAAELEAGHDELVARARDCS